MVERFEEREFVANNRTWLARPSRLIVAVLSAMVLIVTVSNASSASRASRPTSKGTVDVIVDSSLTDATALLAPGFTKATEFDVQQTSGGSAVDAAAIVGKTTKEDVFISQGAAALKSLETTKPSAWLSWFVQFGSSLLVFAYSPKSKFAADLKTMPWYRVVTMPGFKLGLPNAKSFSAGTLAVAALKSAAKTERLAALTTMAGAKGDVYSQATLVARLRSGQVDGGFLLDVDATGAGLRMTSTAPVHLGVSYFITILANAAHQPEAEAFVKFLLGSSASAVLKREGLALQKSPILSGSLQAVPQSLRAVIK